MCGCTSIRIFLETWLWSPQTKMGLISAVLHGFQERDTFKIPDVKLTPDIFAPIVYLLYFELPIIQEPPTVIIWIIS